MVSLYEKGDMPLPFRRILLARQPSPMSCPTVGGIIPKFEARSVVETGDHGLLKLVRISYAKICKMYNFAAMRDELKPTCMALLFSSYTKINNF